jgi:hypothetical protein
VTAKKRMMWGEGRRGGRRAAGGAPHTAGFMHGAQDGGGGAAPASLDSDGGAPRAGHATVGALRRVIRSLSLRNWGMTATDCAGDTPPLRQKHGVHTAADVPYILVCWHEQRRWRPSPRPPVRGVTLSAHDVDRDTRNQLASVRDTSRRTCSGWASRIKFVRVNSMSSGGDKTIPELSGLPARKEQIKAERAHVT